MKLTHPDRNEDRLDDACGTPASKTQNSSNTRRCTSPKRTGVGTLRDGRPFSDGIRTHVRPKRIRRTTSRYPQLPHSAD